MNTRICDKKRPCHGQGRFLLLHLPQTVRRCRVLPQKYTSRESLFRSCLRHLPDHSRGKLHYHLYDLFLCGCVGELGQYRLCLLHEGYGQFAFDYLLYPVYVANVFVTKVHLLKCVDGSLSQRCHNHTCDYCVDDTSCEIDSGYCFQSTNQCFCCCTDCAYLYDGVKKLLALFVLPDAIYPCYCIYSPTSIGVRSTASENGIGTAPTTAAPAVEVAAIVCARKRFLFRMNFTRSFSAAFLPPASNHL